MRRDLIEIFPEGGRPFVLPCLNQKRLPAMNRLAMKFLILGIFALQGCAAAHGKSMVPVPQPLITMVPGSWRQ